jgi:hypothetical protein
MAAASSIPSSSLYPVWRSITSGARLVAAISGQLAVCGVGGGEGGAAAGLLRVVAVGCGCCCGWLTPHDRLVRQRASLRGDKRQHQVGDGVLLRARFCDVIGGSAAFGVKVVVTLRAGGRHA